MNTRSHGRREEMKGAFFSREEMKGALLVIFYFLSARR